jgi:hypothetical protein
MNDGENMKIEENKSKSTSAGADASQKPESKQQAPKTPAPKKKNKSAVQSVLKQIGLGLLFLVIGGIAVLLALYLPASKALKDAQVEVERLTPIESQYLDLQESHAKVQAQVLVYKIMSNASQLQVALIDNDSDRTSQYLGYIEEDLSQLEISDFPDLPTSLLTQFEKVKSNIGSDRLTAIDELQDFYQDLLLLTDNL